MRRTLIGLVAAGALVVAGGCSDADDDDSASSDGGSGGFCATFEQLVADASSDDADPEAARETLTNLEPPSEIEQEWDQYLPVVLRAEEVDMNDPEAVAEFQQEQSDVASAGQAVNQYLAEDCGIESSGGGTGGGGTGGGAEPGADPGAGGPAGPGGEAPPAGGDSGQ